MATVLLVDDDPKIRDLLRLYVERDGHRALFAADGEAALETALRAPRDSQQQIPAKPESTDPDRMWACREHETGAI